MSIYDKFLKILKLERISSAKLINSKAEITYNPVQSLINAFNKLPDLLFQVDKSMRIVWANSKLLAEFPNAIGSFCPELCNSSDILHLGCYCRKAIETGEVTKTHIHKPDSKGIYGQNFWEGTGIPLFNEHGVITGALGVLRNITDVLQLNELEFLTGSGKTGFESINVEKLQIDSYDHFYENIVSGMNVGIAVIDTFKRIKYWNKFMENMTGISFEDIADKQFEDFFAFSENDESKTAIEKSINGETFFIQNGAIEIKSTSKTLWLTGTFSPKYSKDGNIIGSLLTISYFRDYVISESLFQEATETLNALIVSSPSAIMIIDKDGKVKIWNPAAEKMFGWAEDEIIGKQNPVIDTKSAQESSRIFENVMHGSIINSLELVRTKKDGSKINLSLSASPLRDSKGEIKGIDSLLTDITENKSSLKALGESEVRYRSFVQNFQGIAYRLLVDKNLVFISGAVLSITGYTEQDFLEGKLKWRDIIHPEDMSLISEHDDKIGILPGFELDVEYRIIKKDKSIRWVHENLQNITDRQSIVIYIQGTFQDVTQRKEAEEELKRSREHLRNLALHLESTREEEKKQIAFEIHDELGHALTALKLELSWLIKKKHLRQEILAERVKKMSDLIDQTIRKVRSISSELRPSVLDHFGLVAAIEWQTAEFQKRSAVRCKINISHPDIKLAENRSIAIFRILQEILTNIARHAQATRVDVFLDKVDGNVVLRVSDNGRGIKQEQINNRKSFGLIGMFEKANAFGGKVTISGVIGIGTTVTVQIPIAN